MVYGLWSVVCGQWSKCTQEPRLVKFYVQPQLPKMLVVSHEAQRSGVEQAQNGTPLALRA